MSTDFSITPLATFAHATPMADARGGEILLAYECSDDFYTHSLGVSSHGRDTQKLAVRGRGNHRQRNQAPGRRRLRDRAGHDAWVIGDEPFVTSALESRSAENTRAADTTGVPSR